jgi:hypothetical protein|nr:hypothetical protein [Propionibacterium freudenreichii]
MVWVRVTAWVLSTMSGPAVCGCTPVAVPEVVRLVAVASPLCTATLNWSVGRLRPCGRFSVTVSVGGSEQLARSLRREPGAEPPTEVATVPSSCQLTGS